MAAISIPLLILMTISLYVGFFYITFYILHRRERHNLFFSLGSFSVAVYEYFTMKLYGSQIVVESIHYQAGQFITILFFASFIMVFFSDFVCVSGLAKKLLYGLLAVNAALLVIILFSDNLFLLDKQQIVTSFFFKTSFVEALPGRVLDFVYINLILSIGWLLCITVRAYKTGINHIKPLFFTLLFFIMSGINDMLLGIGMIRSMYMVEYGFFILILGMALATQMRYSMMHRTLEELNLSLEEKVKQRTNEINIKRQELNEINRQYQDLFRILSHDLTNSLGGINACIDMVSEGDIKFENIQHRLQVASRNSLGLVEMVRNLRAIDEGKIDLITVNLANTIEDSIVILKHQFMEKDIKVNIDVDKNIFVQAEPVSLTNSVINNIFSNAIKFSYRGSAVDITSECTENTVLLTIKDYGIGIPPELLEKIFDISKVTSRSGTSGERGTGFGMSLVKQFVNLYGGSIKIESTVAGPGLKSGTTVLLELIPGKC